jgi:hypothetical protein
MEGNGEDESLSRLHENYVAALLAIYDPARALEDFDGARARDDREGGHGIEPTLRGNRGKRQVLDLNRPLPADRGRTARAAGLDVPNGLEVAEEGLAEV